MSTHGHLIFQITSAQTKGQKMWKICQPVRKWSRRAHVLTCTVNLQSPTLASKRARHFVWNIETPHSRNWVNINLRQGIIKSMENRFSSKDQLHKISRLLWKSKNLFLCSERDCSWALSDASWIHFKPSYATTSRLSLTLISITPWPSKQSLPFMFSDPNFELISYDQSESHLHHMI
jgi:hypothetical protein